MDTQTWKRELWTWEGGDQEEGEGGMYGESNMETSINICKIYSQWEFVVWIRELKLGLCNNLEVCDGQGGGRGHTYTYE